MEGTSSSAEAAKSKRSGGSGKKPAKEGPKGGAGAGTAAGGDKDKKVVVKKTGLAVSAKKEEAFAEWYVACVRGLQSARCFGACLE